MEVRRPIRISSVPASNLTNTVAALVIRHRQWLLLAILALLHFVLLREPASVAGRVAFLVEVGLAILWQPFIRAERRMPWSSAILMFSSLAMAVFWLNWWMLAGWIMVFAGIVGGKIFFFAGRWSKVFYLLALGYLVMALLLLVLPNAVPAVRLPADLARAMAFYLLPAWLVLMALLPKAQEAEAGGEAIDFIFTIFVFLLLAVLALGSLAIALLFGRGYAQALLYSLLAMGGLLLALGWAWNPHAGFTGVGSVFSRYLLSIGLPIEQWLHSLAELALRREDPQAFLVDACNDMVRHMRWIKGGDWSDGTMTGTFGDCVGRRTEFHHGLLTIGIHSDHTLSPSLIWHFNLLAQLLGEFHADKLRARQLKHLGYLHAVYETGARLTHDVKNLLQSLSVLCAAAEAEAAQPSPELTALLRRQLPVITQRLSQTLEKLQAPREEVGDSVPAGEWFERIGGRYQGTGVECVMAAEVADLSIPVVLFDGAAENLLQNLFEKRRLDASLQVRLEIGLCDGKPALTVEDSGTPIPEALALRLLHEPVLSENGLGIGLYQVARQAELLGYRLELAANAPGGVRFRLRSA